ncbi:MAG: hypothetical protein HC896_13215 [Bacteroidales bacterium]|nr:hypothetical protein [Bacteroidales bacterium]
MYAFSPPGRANFPHPGLLDTASFISNGIYGLTFNGIAGGYNASQHAGNY